MPASRPSCGFERLFVGDSEAERVPVLLNLFEEIAYHLLPERRDQTAPRPKRRLVGDQ
jgi:hypothetical protein